MKIIFNDILSSTSSPVDYAGEVNFISSGLIFEKKLVLAQVFNTVQELVDAYNKLSTDAERQKLEESADAEKILNDPNNRKEFNKRINRFNQKPNASGTGGIVSDAAQFGIDEAEFAGSPGAKFAPFMEKKDQILQKLRPFMSEKKIAEVFYELEDVVKLPFTEVVGVLDDIISKARSCNADVSKVIYFFTEHYKQKRQYTLTKQLITEACELQKLNPVVNIFGVLTEAIQGSQPQVGLMYALKDPDAMKSFNELIMLSQSNLPEQSEEVRRRFQESRDALGNQQQKVNMQRALYDMMKIEETNKQLVEHIKMLGTAFEELLTIPMYRALRNMLYDLRAGKIIMNQAASIFTGDRTPETKRTTPQEQSISREDTYPSMGEERQVFNSTHKFVKLASPEVTRYIYSQTAPKATEQQKQEAGNALSRIMKEVENVKNNVLGALKVLKDIPFVQDVIKFFENLYNVFSNLWNQTKSGTINENSIGQAFNPIFLAFSMMGSQQANPSAPPGIVNSNHTTETAKRAGGYQKSDGKWYIKDRNGVEKELLISPSPGITKKAQRVQQIGTTYSGGNRTTDYINNAIGMIGTIGATILAGVAGGRALVDMLRAGNFADVLNSLVPAVKILMNIIQELFNSLNLTGKNAPLSSQFYKDDGTLSERGKLTLVNARETMISLGISDADAMALSKFQVEKDYLMQFLNKKEQNLRDAETQAVQTGSGMTESTVGTLPKDFQAKIKDFLDYCNNLESKFKANLNLFRNGINNAKKQYDQTQLTHIYGQMEEYKADLLTIQKKKAEWSSLKNIAAHMMRKRILLQKLKPLQTQLDTMKKLGIPMSNIIASPNGILSMSGSIRREVNDALMALRKEHEELSQLIRTPDKISPLVKYPTATGMTQLPESPNQAESTESPFGEEKPNEVKNV
jgi:hypothetical protein